MATIVFMKACEKAHISIPRINMHNQLLLAYGNYMLERVNETRLIACITYTSIVSYVQLHIFTYTAKQISKIISLS